MSRDKLITMIKPNDDNYQNMPALCFSAFDKGKQSII